MKYDFSEIRRVCDGMMRPEVYEKIYQYALGAGEGMFIEIGTAHGAATTCLALAKKDSGTPGDIVTFARFGTGTRKNYRDAEQNRPRTEAGFKRFGVSDRITIIEGSVEETYRSFEATRPISLIMLDADGRIERDLFKFAGRLHHNALVIVDDYADRVRSKRLNETMCKLDQKHRLTYHLVNSAMDEGILALDFVQDATWFGRLYGSPSSWRMSKIIDAYAHLTRATFEATA